MLERLGNRASNSWVPLPPWARFLVSLGEFAFRECAPDQRITLAVSVPTRSLAVTLLAVGVVAADYNDELGRSDPERFQELLGLPPGTQVRLIERGQPFLGQIEGVQEQDGRTLLRVALSKTDRRSLPASKAWAVEVVNVPDWVPGDRLRRLGNASVSEFVVAAFSPVDGSRMALPAGLDCAIIGVKELITREATNCNLAASVGNRMVVGTLDELLRPDVPPYTLSPRVRLVSSNATPQRVRGQLRGTTILDGARAFLRLGTEVAGTRVVVLDRSEGRYPEALAQLQADYRRRTLVRPPSLPHPPPGIEITSFVGTALRGTG